MSLEYQPAYTVLSLRQVNYMAYCFAQIATLVCPLSWTASFSLKLTCKDNEYQRNKTFSAFE
jgi:hypothetical protein